MPPPGEVKGVMARCRELSKCDIEKSRKTNGVICMYIAGEREREPRFLINL